MTNDATPQEAFTELVTSIRDLGAILGPAVAAQFEAPPGGAASGGGQVPNPTLDIVLDARRLALSDEIRSVTTSLRRAARLLGQHQSSLSAAVARWEGGEEGASCLTARP